MLLIIGYLPISVASAERSVFILRRWAGSFSSKNEVPFSSKKIKIILDHFPFSSKKIK
jgi:hypothetical protein